MQQWIMGQVLFFKIVRENFSDTPITYKKQKSFNRYLHDLFTVYSWHHIS